MRASSEDTTIMYMDTDSSPISSTSTSTSPSNSPQMTMSKQHQPQPHPYHTLTFTHPPDHSLPPAAELEYLTHTAFLPIRALPIPPWMRAHIATNFRAEIDNTTSSTWDEHVQMFLRISQIAPAHHRITKMTPDVEPGKADAYVFCHMEATSLPTGIKRLGMAQLRWKRHPLDGRWQLVHIFGMREPPSDLHGDVSSGTMGMGGMGMGMPPDMF